MASQGSNKSDKKLQKSYFDVLGLCCSSEVPLIEKILNSIEGVEGYSVVLPTKTVIVFHNTLLVSQLQIAKALNQARLEANVRVNGKINYQKRWPSPFSWASGALLLLSLIKFVYPPFGWLALGAVAIGIIPIFLKAITSIRNLRLDTNVLVLIAVIGTVSLRDYLEAGTIVFLFGIAEWLEARAGNKAQAVMSSLMSLAPQRAVIAETGEEVDADEVKLNTVLAVKAGEVIPIDGVVVDGMCEVDEKTLTGESFPVSKEKDSTVWAGTINLNGYISVKTTALAEDCVVAKMTKLVEEAQNSKSKTQRFIDKCAKYYTPVVIIASASTAVVPLALRAHNRNHWFHLALVVLVSACPCPLILSTPVATFCALTKAATAGLLFKGGEYLETMAKTKVVAFDKTGTLTRGEFVVNDFRSLSDDISLDKLLYWVSSIESKSSHPMAVALVEYVRSLSIEPKPEDVEEFQNYPGEGIHGRIDGRSIYIGNRKIALRAGTGTVPTEECNKSRGKTIGFVYCEGEPAGIFSLSDMCRTGAKDAVKELNTLHIKTVMLTGDIQSAAAHAQEELGNSLRVVHSELLPEDKARIIESFKKEGITAMVGDGINDAPALATADIGISMGVSGSALATETGQVILLSNDIRKVPKAIKLARKALRKVIENVMLSISAKAAILALAFAGHPLIWAAVLADVGTCLLVILNSMTLLRGTDNHSGKCCKSSTAENSSKHGSNSSSHNYKQCCSDKKVVNTCGPQKLKTCTSSCKTGTPNTASCQGKKVTDSRGKQNVAADACMVKEAKCCDDRSSQMSTDDLEANHLPKDHCLGCHNSGIGSAAAVQAKCAEDNLLGAEHCRDFCCRTPTHQVVNNHCSQSINSREVQRLTPSTTHCVSNCCKERVESRINNASLGKIGESSSNNQHQRQDDGHHDRKSCCIGESDHIGTRTKHACLSLENRETKSCCRSYMKECCDHNGHSHSSRFIGVLSEIVTE